MTQHRQVKGKGAGARQRDPERERAAAHGELLKARRLELGLKRPAFVAEVARHGPAMTPDYLNKLESGARALANASPELREAIRAVLGIDPHGWHALTGLYSPGAARPPGQRGPLPPVVDPLQLPLRIPPELQAVIDEHAGTFPELRNETTLRALTAPRLFGGHEQGPQTGEQWLEYFLMNRRWWPK